MIISQDNEKKLSQLAEDLKENVTIKDRKHHFVRSEWNSNHMNMNNMYNIGGNNERLVDATGGVIRARWAHACIHNINKKIIYRKIS